MAHFIAHNAFRQWTALMTKVRAAIGLAAIIWKIGIAWAQNLQTIRDHVLGRGTFALKRISMRAQVVACSSKQMHLETRPRLGSSLWPSRWLLELRLPTDWLRRAGYLAMLFPLLVMAPAARHHIRP